MRVLRDVWACRWAARRMQRHLDADVDAPLSAADLARLEAHLEQCGQCRALRDQFLGLSGLLRRLAVMTEPDADSVIRMQRAANAIKVGSIPSP